MLKAMLVALGYTPSVVVVGFGFLIGAVTSWAGWNAGKRSVTPPQAVAQPA